MLKTIFTAIALCATSISGAHAQVAGRSDMCLYFQNCADGNMPNRVGGFYTAPVAPVAPIHFDIAMPPKPMQEQIRQCIESTGNARCIKPMTDYLMARGYSAADAKRNAFGFVNVFTHRAIIEGDRADMPYSVGQSAVTIFVPKGWMP